jgi:hypothetical protein
VIGVGTIGQDYISKGAPVLVEAMGLDRNVFAEGGIRGRLLPKSCQFSLQRIRYART